MSLDDLPAGLPPGRLVTPNPEFNPTWTGGPVCWASQQPLPDAPQQWARLQAVQDHTGLRPVLFWPGDAREPCHPSQIDALDAETILLRKWHHLERRQQGMYSPEQHRAMLADIPQGRRRRHPRRPRPAVHLLARPDPTSNRRPRPRASGPRGHRAKPATPHAHLRR